MDSISSKKRSEYFGDCFLHDVCCPHLAFIISHKRHFNWDQELASLVGNAYYLFRWL